ncbi:MAG: isoleucine--tRNA ligase [Ignavibacteria bacterium]|nr:isoleucine--tRNA ligase [Ignavibacteria bacterium]
MYKQYSDKIKYSEIEKRILEFWEENKIFEKSIETRDPKKNFTFYEGPPTANGRPGIHHVMARTIKDIICRYKTLQGYRVNRKAGWDTHGLPVEIEVEKELGIKTKDEIVLYGVEKFNQACKNSVFTYVKDWNELTRRIGYWINLDDAYITCTNEYIESVWWSLKKFFDEGYIYKGFKIQPYCTRCETPLSSHELSLGYQDVKDPSIYVAVKIKNQPDTFFLVWTTTPWTLISNVALAVNKDVDYVKVKLLDENKTPYYLILAEARTVVLPQGFEVVEKYKGQDLLGWEYERLFDYVPVDKKAFYVIEGDFVTTEDGSGIVHIAPAFGEDDYQVGKKYDLPLINPVDKSGRFNELITDFKSMHVKEADPHIIQNLKSRKLLFKKETIEHSYPHCWRCKSPLLYYARESWYIATTKYVDMMIELNKQINWYPPEVGKGRFGNWLEENKDWALSRDRFWGTPLPIWVSEDGDMFAIGSIEELKEGYFLTDDGKKIPVSELTDLDLHKPYVDKIIFEKNGKVYRRTPELIDVWYDSGSMPFAQFHYPFENKEVFEQNYPADFIAEGIDQTRGWFYSLHAIGTFLFKKPAYKNVIVNELILDKEGKKMSKSLGNTVDPFEIVEKYGADTTRWYLVSNSPPWKATLFNEDDLFDVQRKFFGTLINTYAFFALYANLDGFKYEEDEIPFEKRPEIDKWILSALNVLIKEVKEYFDDYDITKAARAISEFTIEQLSNWYVRRNRRRFWKSEMNADKISAYQTLYHCLITIAKLSSPIAPFISEEIYRCLNSVTNKEPYESVHLSLYPEVGPIDEQLLHKMEVAQKIVSIVRSIRSKNNLKVRQPLQKMLVVVKKEDQDSVREMEQVILEEVNVKELQLLDTDSDIVIKKAKPNFKSIGPKFGKKVNLVANAIRNLDGNQIKQIESGQNIILQIEGENLEITPSDVEVFGEEIKGWIVESEDGITVSLDTNLTPELIEEGLAREFINRVQNMRKDADFEVSDRISIMVEGSENLQKAISKMKSYIMQETLAEELEFGKCDSGFVQEWKVGSEECKISITKK